MAVPRNGDWLLPHGPASRDSAANDKKVFRSTVNAVNAYDGLFRGFFGFDDHRCLGLEPGQNVCGERDDRRGDNHRRENQYPNASVHLITHPR